MELVRIIKKKPYADFIVYVEFLFFFGWESRYRFYYNRNPRQVFQVSKDGRELMTSIKEYHNVVNAYRKFIGVGVRKLTDKERREL